MKYLLLLLTGCSTYCNTYKPIDLYQKDMVFLNSTPIGKGIKEQIYINEASYAVCPNN